MDAHDRDVIAIHHAGKLQGIVDLRLVVGAGFTAGGVDSADLVCIKASTTHPHRTFHDGGLSFTVPRGEGAAALDALLDTLRANGMPLLVLSDRVAVHPVARLIGASLHGTPTKPGRLAAPLELAAHLVFEHPVHGVFYHGVPVDTPEAYQTLLESLVAIFRIT